MELLLFSHVYVASKDWTHAFRLAEQTPFLEPPQKKLFSVYGCIAYIIYVYMCTTCVPGALGDLELELETFVLPYGC